MTMRGVMGILILVGLSAYGIDEWTARSLPSPQAQTAIVGLPVPVTPPASTPSSPSSPTNIPNSNTGSCQQSYEACLKNTPSSAAAVVAVAQVCETNWKNCVTKKCVTGSLSGGIKECVKDPDCASSCTEDATSEGGLLDCCLGGPQHNNSCPKKIDGKCGGAPASAAPTPVACTSLDCASAQAKSAVLSKTTTGQTSPSVSAGSLPPSAQPNVDQAAQATPPVVNPPAAAPAGNVSADTGIKAIAGSAPAAAGGGTASVPAAPAAGGTISSAPPTAPTGPAFQSPPSYLSGGVPPSPSALPAAATGLPIQTGQSGLVTNTWSPGYSSAANPSVPATISAATNQSLGSGSFFGNIVNLFGGLFGGSSGGSSAPAPAAAQKSSVQNIIQLFVETPPASGSVVPAATIPAPVQNGSNPLAYNMVILGTPPSPLSGTPADSLAQDNFQKLLALMESGAPAGTAYGVAPSSFSSSTVAQMTVSPMPSDTTAALSNAGTLNSQLGSTSPAITPSNPITFVQPYAVSATAPAGPNGFSSAQDLIDTYAGGWTNGKITDPAEALLENRAALAQVQTNYAATQAALASWQALADAGLCPQTCQNTIAVLSSQLPNQEKQMNTLIDAVYQGTATASLTQTIDSGITGLARDPEHAAQLLTTGASQTQSAYYLATGALNSSENTAVANGTAIQTIAQYDVPADSASSTGSGDSLVASEVQHGNSSTGFPEALTRVWSAVTGWLSPNTPSTTPSGLGCSLLGSLFGFCQRS